MLAKYSRDGFSKPGEYRKSYMEIIPEEQLDSREVHDLVMKL